jgi:hypothetical protein
MHHRDDLKSSRERTVAKEVMKLELRQARERSAGRAEELDPGRRRMRDVIAVPSGDDQPVT